MVDSHLAANGTASYRCVDSVATVNNASAADSSPCKLLPPVHDCSSNTMEMEVTITVLSLHGILAKKHEPKKKSLIPTQRKNNATISTTTSLVASCCQTFSTDDDKPLLTHVPSSPMDHLDASVMMSSQPTLQPIVHWPSMMDRVDGGDREQEVLSTLRFSRRFDREEATSFDQHGRRFIPQTCPIDISMARHGKLIGLGKANIIITGEEKGEPSMMVRINSTYKRFKGRKNLMKKVRRKKSSTPMMKMKGDDLMFGLQNDAMLRVLVSVNDLQSANEVHEEEQVAETHSDGHVDLACRESCDKGKENNLVSTEDDDNAVVAEHLIDGSQKASDSDDAILGSGSKELIKSLDSDNSFTYIGDIVQSDISRSPSLLALSDHNFVAGAKQEVLIGEEPETKTTEAAVSKSVDNLEDSVPDIFALDETATTLDATTLPDANNSEDVGAALSWCALTAILGSPAPSSVTKNKRKRETSLFCDLGEDDGIPDLHVDEEDTDQFVKDGAGVDLDKTFDTISLSLDESEDEADVIDCFDHVPEIDDADETNGMIFPYFDEPSTKDAVDAALAWSALTMILNAPAPTAVSMRTPKRLFEDDDSVELGDILFPALEEKGSFESIDDVPSLAETEESPQRLPQGNKCILKSLDHVPEIDDADETNGIIFPYFDEPSTKDAADAALAWSALTMILNAPAPAAVSKQGASQSASKPLFDDDEASVELDDVLFPAQEEHSSIGDESIYDVPSLAETDASLSPRRTRRQYKYAESIEENDMMTKLEAMANLVDQCPYCELLCCEQFPCPMRVMMEKGQNQ